MQAKKDRISCLAASRIFPKEFVVLKQKTPAPSYVTNVLDFYELSFLHIISSLSTSLCLPHIHQLASTKFHVRFPFLTSFFIIDKEDEVHSSSLHPLFGICLCLCSSSIRQQECCELYTTNGVSFTFHFAVT
jgi:hypothetical protein